MQTVNVYEINRGSQPRVARPPRQVSSLEATSGAGSRLKSLPFRSAPNDLFTDHYGFVVDYLAEALRELRRHNFTEICDRHFSMGSHLVTRDRKAVKKTVSGLMKIVYPHGHATKEEIAELLEFAMEGQRRVKEQLKKMGSFEYYQTSFSYTDVESGEERFVGVPEQGGRSLISSDPLSPGTAYAGTVATDGTVGMFRVEVSVSAGAGKLRTAGGVTSATKESINRAFSYMLAKKSEMGIARELDVSDLHVEVIDLLNNRVEGEIGLGFFVAAISALKKAPSMAALLVTGDLSVQGNIKGLRSLVEPLQVAMDNGARRALIPLENKRNFLEVTGDIMEHVDRGVQGAGAKLKTSFRRLITSAIRNPGTDYGRKSGPKGGGEI